MAAYSHQIILYTLFLQPYKLKFRGGQSELLVLTNPNLRNGTFFDCVANYKLQKQYNVYTFVRIAALYYCLFVGGHLKLLISYQLPPMYNTSIFMYNIFIIVIANGVKK